MKAQLDSLLNQTWPNLEIIISDDASKDGTRTILSQYQNDPRIHLFFQENNLGPVNNFSFATAKAKGTYLAFSDQDDIWLPEKIDCLMAGIGNKSLVYSDSILIDESGLSLQKNLSDLRHLQSVKGTKGFLFSNVVWGHAMMIHRSLLVNVLPIPASIPHDIWFAVNAAALTGIEYVNQPLTLYRQHQTTVTKTLPVKTKARSATKRWHDFNEKLNWIQLVASIAPSSEKAFYKKLLDLYSSKATKIVAFPLLVFLLINCKDLFAFVKKTSLSKTLEIIKIARGEPYYNS